MPLIRYTQECLDAANGKWPGIEPGSKRKDRPRAIPVFQNWALENIFGKAHWATPILWFGPVITWGIYSGLKAGVAGVGGTIGLFFAGVLAWTLLEYVLHRFLFHLEPKKPEDRLRAFLMHGYHHDFPDDNYRLVAPPVMSWGPALIVATIYYFTLGPALFGPMMAGTSAGYVAYDWIHYYTHHARPTTRLGKWIRRYHMLHHFKHGDACYGVSNPLWDVVFGTYRPVSRANESASAEQAAH